MSACKNCTKDFTISPQDSKYYKKLNVPEPTFCPMCRQQRRFAIRNERNLYKRTCDLCKKNIVSMYSTDKPFPVYCPDCWWSDKWEGTDFAQEYDFGPKVTFFDQFKELQAKVPRISLYLVRSENADYCNFVGDVKNSYLIFGSVYSEDCMYGSPYYSKDCVDSLVLRECELCYECTDCRKLYDCKYCQDCYNSNDLLFCYDLQGCSDCIACAGLRNKKYHIENKPVSKEEYEKIKDGIDFCDASKVKELQEKLNRMKLEIPHHFMPNKNVENVSGSHIYNSKNINKSFFIDKCEDCSYCAQVVDLKDCYDNNYTEENELCCDYLGMYGNKYMAYSTFARHAHFGYYSEYCISGENFFGCSNIKKKNYCILNKPHSKEEYKVKLEKIISHMKETGEWGEFFPISHSFFGYNETVAQEFFPLTKEQALEKGYPWKDEDPKEYQPQNYSVPAKIDDVPDSIIDEILACEACGKNYKVISKELFFYKRIKLPIPSKCPNCRHQGRLALRNPYRIVTRNCDKCETEIQTAYGNERKEKVYCEKCYLEVVY